ncbi:MAG: M50 family metallopeptidase [Acidobacteria bacterium]|nr:M50 family metallopeptidase [Acidobacteriota bacterium]
MADQLRRHSNDGRTILMLAAIFVAIALLWGTVIVTPLKIFVVLLHEISHGVAAVATGGEIVRIEVNPEQGGICYTRGGNGFVTLSAGYLGSMLWGALILIAAARTRYDRYISGAIGAFILIVALLYVRNLFGFAAALLFALALILCGWKLSGPTNDFVLKVIGMTSCLYAVLDIVDDVLRRPGIGSDADMLAQNTGIPSLAWGALWVLSSVVTTAFSLWIASKGES